MLMGTSRFDNPKGGWWGTGVSVHPSAALLPLNFRNLAYDAKNGCQSRLLVVPKWASLQKVLEKRVVYLWIEETSSSSPGILN